MCVKLHFDSPTLGKSRLDGRTICKRRDVEQSMRLKRVPLPESCKSHFDAHELLFLDALSAPTSNV